MWSARAALAALQGLTPQQLDATVRENTHWYSDVPSLGTLYPHAMERLRHFELCAAPGCERLFPPTPQQRGDVAHGRRAYCPHHSRGTAHRADLPEENS